MPYQITIDTVEELEALFLLIGGTSLKTLKSKVNELDKSGTALSDALDSQKENKE